MGGVIIDKPINAKWGDYSLIECEMLLFKTSFEYSTLFDYFHLISGVDLPIKPMHTIHNFFLEHQGLEFIRIADTSFNTTDIFMKTNYYHLFMPFSRTLLGKCLRKLKFARLSLSIQKHIGISRCKKDSYTLYKGYQWCSLTRNAVEYLISKESFIKNRFKYTSCPDEIYKQSLLMNSPFKKNIYSSSNTALREIDWKRGTPYTWKMEDKDILMQSDNLFARKFSSANKDIIDYIANNI